jgi:predicted DNA-binding WGR domain protein
LSGIEGSLFFNGYRIKENSDVKKGEFHQAIGRNEIKTDIFRKYQMQKKLIFTDEKSAKFWNIETDGKKYSVTFGKIGTNGQTQTKEFENEEACLKEAEKIVNEKLKKGYVGKKENGDSGDYPSFLQTAGNASGDELRKALHSHFQPWLLTRDCEKVFEYLMGRLKKCTIEGQTFSLVFNGDGYDGEGADVQAFFGEPEESEGDDSFSMLKRMHGRIILGDPDDGGVSVYFPSGGYDPYDVDESVLERFEDFCDAGQNWFVFDHENKNSLGEPAICLWDHGAELEESEPYPGQEKDSYGAGGFLLRVLAYLLSPDGEEYEAFNYG